jgi:putative ABC transport system substrate-binding protein
LGPDTRSLDGPRLAAFVQRLRELGWIEDRTIAIEYRWAEGRNEHLAEIATELVRRKVDVIVTSATPPTVAAKQATSVIPIGSRRSATRSGPAWWHHWRDRAAT